MMNLKDIDQFKTSKLITQLIENVTCDACCNYYMAPQTASCGHSLCHTCWRGHQKCVICDKPVERQSLRCCGPIQDCTEDTHALADAYTKIFKKSAAEAHQLLVEAYGEGALSERMCREWFQKFKNGDFDVEDKDHSGRPKIYEDAELKELLEEDSKHKKNLL